MHVSTSSRITHRTTANHTSLSQQVRESPDHN